jgi:hypothetical protein
LAKELHLPTLLGSKRKLIGKEAKQLLRSIKLNFNEDDTKRNPGICGRIFRRRINQSKRIDLTNK